jgi:hypothetical protein
VNNPHEATSTQIVQLATDVTGRYFEFTETELAECKRRELKYFSSVVIHEMTEPFPQNELNVRNSEHLEALQIIKDVWSKNKELSLQNTKLLNEIKDERKQLDYQTSLYWGKEKALLMIS